MKKYAERLSARRERTLVFKEKYKNETLFLSKIVKVYLKNEIIKMLSFLKVRLAIWQCYNHLIAHVIRKVKITSTEE